MSLGEPTPLCIKQNLFFQIVYKWLEFFGAFNEGCSRRSRIISAFRLIVINLYFTMFSLGMVFRIHANWPSFSVMESLLHMCTNINWIYVVNASLYSDLSKSCLRQLRKTHLNNNYKMTTLSALEILVCSFDMVFIASFYISMAIKTETFIDLTGIPALSRYPVLARVLWFLHFTFVALLGSFMCCTQAMIAFTTLSIKTDIQNWGQFMSTSECDVQILAKTHTKFIEMITELDSKLRLTFFFSTVTWVCNFCFNWTAIFDRNNTGYGYMQIFPAIMRTIDTATLGFTLALMSDCTEYLSSCCHKRVVRFRNMEHVKQTAEMFLSIKMKAPLNFTFLGCIPLDRGFLLSVFLGAISYFLFTLTIVPQKSVQEYVKFNTSNLGPL